MASWSMDEIQPGSVIKAEHMQQAMSDAQGDIDLNGNELQNVSEITFTDPSATRGNLGLGDSATKDVGTGSGDVAAGDDSRFVSNGNSHDHSGGDGGTIAYSSLSGTPTLGDAAAKNVGTGAGTVAAGDDSRFVTNGNSHDHNGGDGAQIAYSNLSGTPTLGNAAALDVGTGSGDVAAGNHNHSGVYEPANANIQSHISSTSNPHSVTSTQVGLGSVQNYDIASQGEAEAGSVSNKYMTPERTAQAIAALAPGGGGGASELDDLDDVTITTPNDGDVLTYDDGEWVNAPPTGGGGGAEDLVDLGDVNISSPSDGDLLAYDNGSSKWINVAPPSGTLPTQTGHDGAFLYTDGSDAAWLDGMTFDGTTLTTTVPAEYLKHSADGNTYTFTFKKRGQTGDADGAVKSGTSLGAMVFHGWDGTWFYPIPSAYIAANTVEDFDASHHGAHLDFSTIISGGVFQGLRLRISGETGNVLVGTGTDDGQNKLQINGSTAALRFKHAVTETTFSTTPTFNASTASSFVITLEDDVSSSTVSNAIAGQTITFKIIQDGTGGREFAWASNVLGGMTIDATAQPNEIFTQQFHCFDGTNYEAISLGARR